MKNLAHTLNHPFKNFVRVECGIDTSALLNEINTASHLWQEDTSRQRKVKCQRNTWNIFLRAAQKPLPKGTNNANDVHETRTMRYSKFFPKILYFCQRFAEEQRGDLGRVTLVTLLPKSKVYPHTDFGDYYAVRDRYHLVLDSPSGSRLTAGNETAILLERELWVFNNKIVHSAENLSDKLRVHLIFDILPSPDKGYFTRSCKSMG